EALVARLKKIKVPVVVVINKVDQSGIDEINKLVHGWKKHLQPHAVIPASAINDFNTTVVRDTLLEVLPESPAFFPKDDVSDASLRFFTAEFIREKIFMHYRDEIPYASTVDIEAFKEGEQQVHISAVIYVERDSQKGILIGKKGSSIKRVGTEARHDIESFLGKKVFLELFVKVEKDWRKHENKLRRFGYSS
ncbi:MAG: GTPase Era, partial [Bacteroidia bacterium]|nr:GTPase Era [Bacteroidia bacterium]